jgi:hypothetical protein
MTSVLGDPSNISILEDISEYQNIHNCSRGEAERVVVGNFMMISYSLLGDVEKWIKESTRWRFFRSRRGVPTDFVKALFCYSVVEKADKAHALLAPQRRDDMVTIDRAAFDFACMHEHADRHSKCR